MSPCTYQTPGYGQVGEDFDAVRVDADNTQDQRLRNLDKADNNGTIF